MLFWIIVVSLGLEGAIADVALNQWSKTYSLYWYVVSTLLYLVFMTGFGVSMQLGMVRGYSLTIAVVLVLLVSIVGVALWDLTIGGTRLTATQWLGVTLATVAMICFELGRK